MPTNLTAFGKWADLQHACVFWEFELLVSLHFCDFWDLGGKSSICASGVKISSGALCAPGRRREGRCRRQLKAVVQCSYAQTRSGFSEHPFEADLRLPGELQRLLRAPRSRAEHPCRWRLGVLCVLESGGLCSPKMSPGRQFGSFGVWGRLPTTFGPRGTRG